MNQLLIGPPETESCRHPPGCHRWPDPAGNPFCCCYVEQGGPRVHRPGIATYAPDAITPHTDVPPERLRQQYERDILPMLVQFDGREVLHAGAAHLPRGVVAFCGDTGAGKSTLACAMGARGHTVWADDALALDGTNAVPIPFSMRLRPPTAARFPDPPATVALDHPPVSLAAICLLHRADTLELHRIDGAAAFPLLLRHAYCFSLQIPELKERMLRNYFALVTHVPVFELRCPTGLDRLDATCGLIERLP